MFPGGIKTGTTAPEPTRRKAPRKPRLPVSRRCRSISDRLLPAGEEQADSRKNQSPRKPPGSSGYIPEVPARCAPAASLANWHSNRAGIRALRSNFEWRPRSGPAGWTSHPQADWKDSKPVEADPGKGRSRKLVIGSWNVVSNCGEWSHFPQPCREQQSNPAGHLGFPKHSFSNEHHS